MLVKITDEEAALVGITTDTPCDPREGKMGWGEMVKPLLMKHGVPEKFLQPGDMRCVPVARHPRDNLLFPQLDPSIPGMVFIVNNLEGMS